MADGSGTALGRLLRSADPGEQTGLREALSGEARLDDLRTAYLNNPFLQLSDTDAESLTASAALGSLDSLIAARHAAMQSRSPRYVVFCMPKSGSSFTQSALSEALQLPLVSLTTVGSGSSSSYFGMNAREQEIDEFALVKSILAAPQGFVAQHHTRYTQYLGLQMRAFGLTPILTIRNIFDCLVSFDDMMLAARAAAPPDNAWVLDPYVLPHDYQDRPPQERYALLAPSLGVWLVQFLLSWKRGIKQALFSPVVIRYETDILDPTHFVEVMSERLGLREDQRLRLAAYTGNPDPKRSRLNVGTAGRGRELIPDEARRLLTRYVEGFGDEFSPGERRHLLS